VLEPQVAQDFTDADDACGIGRRWQLELSRVQQ
jgi:hypothetical protein